MAKRPQVNQNELNIWREDPTTRYVKDMIQAKADERCDTRKGILNMESPYVTQCMAAKSVGYSEAIEEILEIFKIKEE